MDNLLPENWEKFSESELENNLLPELRANGKAAAEEAQAAGSDVTQDQYNAVASHLTAINDIEAELAARASKLEEASGFQAEIANALASFENATQVEDTTETATDEADADVAEELSSEETAEEAAEETTEDAEELSSESEEASTDEVVDSEETTEEASTEEASTDEVAAEAEEASSEESDSAETAADETAEELSSEEETGDEASDEVAEEMTDEASEELASDESADEDSSEDTDETAEELSSEEASEATDETTTETEETTSEELSIENNIKEEDNMADAVTEGAEAPDFFVSSQDSQKGVVTASPSAITQSSGEAFADARELADEAIAQFRKHGGDKRWPGVGNMNMDETWFAHSDFSNENDKMLSTINEEGNWSALTAVSDNYNAEVTESVVDGDSLLVASGGICAPFQQDYSFFRCAEPQTFVESCLPRVAAPRGGIKFILPPDFKAARQGITTITCEEDAANYESTPEECGGPGTTEDKPCVCVECPDVAECCVTAVPWCVRWGNFNYYTFPELVENFMRDLQVNYAKVKETYYLDAIMAESTPVTAASNYSAVRDIIGNLRAAAVNYRKRHNMNLDSVLQVMAPHWILDVIRQDFANSQYGSNPLDYLKVSDAQIAQCLRDLGLQLCLYYDTPTVLPDGVPSQAFDQDQEEGPLNMFPSKAVTFMYKPGTFVRLDGGSLDFGIIRDSSLIKTNDFIMAAEQFIGLCKVGLESLAIIHDICPTGSGAAPKDAIDCEA